MSGLLLLGLALAAPLRGGSVRAKTQWRTVQSGQIQVHYPRVARGRHPMTGQRLAQQIATQGERLWFELCDQLGDFPRGTVHIVLLEDADRLRGFTVTPWRWLVISGTPGPELLRSRGAGDWSGELLAHELAHVVSHDLARPLADSAAYGLRLDLFAGPLAAGAAGAGVIVDDGPPAWWSEGGAELWSEAVGVNHWSSAREASLREAVLSDTLLSWSALTAAPSQEDWGRAEQRYLQGYAFGRYLRQRFNQDVLRAMAVRMGEGWRADPGAALAEVTGVAGAQLHADWIAVLRARYGAERDAVLQAGQVVGRPAASESGWTLYPAEVGPWQVASSNGWLQIRRGDEQAWWPMRRLGRPALLPDASAVIVAADERLRGRWRPDPGSHWSQLWSVSLAPKPWSRRASPGHANYQRIPGTLRARDPAVSADGQRLAWVRYSDGASALMVSAVDGSEARALSAFGPGSFVRHPSWSPDGRRLVVSLQRHGQVNLWQVALDSGQWTPLTWGAADALDPVWSADGRIVFSWDLDGVFELYRLDPASGALHQLTRSGSAAITPSVTSTGEILYSRLEAEGYRPHRLVAPLELPRQAPALASEAERTAFLAPLPGPALPDRPYRARRSLLPLAVQPRVQLDSSPVPDLRSGAWLRLSDALERHTLSLSGLLGSDLFASGRYTWRGGPLEVSAWAQAVGSQHSRAPSWPQAPSPIAAEALQVAGGGLRLPYGPSLALRADVLTYRYSLGTLRSQPQLSSLRLGAGLELGDPQRLSGAAPLDVGWARASWHHGRSRPRAAEPYSFERVELVGRGALEAIPGSGHALEGELTLGWTSREVQPYEALRVGGIHPSQWAPYRVEDSVAFVVIPAYQWSGQGVAVVSAGWRLPLLRSAHARLGPVVLQELQLSLGGAAAAVDNDTPRGALTGSLRLGSALFGSDWNSSLSAGWTPGGSGRILLAIGDRR